MGGGLTSLFFLFIENVLTEDHIDGIAKPRAVVGSNKHVLKGNHH